MTEIKTLKDLKELGKNEYLWSLDYDDTPSSGVEWLSKQLKAEAVKLIKEYKKNKKDFKNFFYNPYAVESWTYCFNEDIERFLIFWLNLTEADLK
jgi:hypothetical protein